MGSVGGDEERSVTHNTSVNFSYRQLRVQAYNFFHYVIPVGGSTLIPGYVDLDPPSTVCPPPPPPKKKKKKIIILGISGIPKTN